mmetsp:Transcript_18978/g.44230  ORF Transcript_18978/g.44230 Transcript_18978/m.44230 type:complete len:82 (+) Transcript_18978:1429-1674(+)
MHAYLCHGTRRTWLPTLAPLRVGSGMLIYQSCEFRRLSTRCCGKGRMCNGCDEGSLDLKPDDLLSNAAAEWIDAYVNVNSS